MLIDCPRCHNSIEVAGEPNLLEVVCPSCGKSSRLAATATMTLAARIPVASRSAAMTESFPASTFDKSTAPARATRAYDAPYGPVLGDYELLDRIGAGGMGVVYRARQRSANRLVALKVIRPDRLVDLAPEARAETLHRFLTEAQAAARLEHDHIVTVYDVGESAGQPFYSMRYVEGRSLADVLRDGPLENRSAAAFLEPVARAVHFAHEHGILHRDLKPQNVLLDSNERPYVTDFGLAKRSNKRSKTHNIYFAMKTLREGSLVCFAR